MGNVLYELNFNWIESVPYIIPLFVGMGFFFTFKWYPSQNPGTDQKCSKGYVGYVVAKWVGWIVGTFAFCLFVLLTMAHVVDYREKREILDNNHAIVVEGMVEKYHAQPLSGHDTEHFEINGIYFEYSSGELLNGYNTPACYGGVIKENGQHLKIKYLKDDIGNNIILYIEEIE